MLFRGSSPDPNESSRNEAVEVRCSEIYIEQESKGKLDVSCKEFLCLSAGAFSCLRDVKKISRDFHRSQIVN